MWDTLYKYRNILQIQQFKTHKLFKRKILFKYLQLRINKFEYASSKLVLYFILFGTRSLLNTRPDRFDRFDVYKIQTDRQKNVLNFMYETIENRIYREELKESLGMHFVSPFQPEREFKVYK